MKKFTFILFLFLFSCTSKNELFTINLKNLSNKKFSLDEVKNNKLSIFYFLAPECPLSQNYTKAINEIYNQYASQDIVFYGVFCGTVYSDEEMNSFVNDYSIKMNCLKDIKYQLSGNLNATITPEVFVVNNNGKTVYSGRIDNWVESLGVKRQVVTKFYLKDALSQYLNGEAILINKTEAVGCILE